MRFVRRLTLIALLAGLFAWLRKVLSDEIVARTTESRGRLPRRLRLRAEPRPEGRRRQQRRRADQGRALWRAQELGIEGRSRMSKAELQRAISQAG